MPPKTYLIDLAEAKLPKEFGFPELGIDGEVLLDIMVKSVFYNEDLIFDLQLWMQQMYWDAQSDQVIDQFYQLRTYLWDIAQKEPMQGVPRQFRCVKATRIMNEYAALTFSE